MAHEEPPAELYDFIYRDSARVTSYYAQAFGGLLSSLEETDLKKQASEKTGKMSAWVVSGEGKAAQEIQESSKRIVNPHDIIITDTLTHLASADWASKDVANSPHGSIVLAHGSVMFLDHSMNDLGVEAMKMAAAEERRKSKKERNANLISFYELLGPFVSKMQTPSAFLFDADGILLGGVIKEAGMEEPIPSYYYRHGMNGLADVYLIGIKEVPKPFAQVEGTVLFGAMRQAAEALSNMLFPPSAIRITPIAIFRKLVRPKTI